MLEDGRKIYSVSELNREIKAVLEDTHPDIWLEGEVSNFKVYSSGHMYFSLKDAEAQISAVIFQGVNRFFKFKLEDGLKILARGKVSAYPKRGEYQLIISSAEPAGKGALQLAFEQLKAKLEKEGLFDKARKRPIPALPGKIGIVTSSTGAAIRDILTIINRRFANVEILLYPVRVQGDEAKFDIVEAIEYLNARHPELDVLLVGRGGGSYEDLWAFNEEMVARAIAASKIPIISCVGHEIDFTIADFVADLRAPTPSAAAELVVKNKTELADRINKLGQMITNIITHRLSSLEEKIKYLSQSRALTRPQEIFEERIQEVDDLFNRLNNASKLKVENLERDLKLAGEKLELLSPLGVLARGYAIAWTQPANTIIKNTSQINLKDKIRLRLGHGELTASVESKTEK
ncbi:MAG TPA: exodeoxyribonuclease VII large subunit [Elusimicrobia bacterium]|nr:MAG: hypothetical protein A2278_00645 [Elusimicrobia bacterium RIFOXYA12_FULL_49_49]OGS15164.1 MAG: hypothetical protein A2251_00655 [Elusimicrobia bacterium RIFOXYA2_FULL_47_53]OGS29784.1 MAG: hypothetical protein A2323_01455 [Elusimicrobia bacterium RIFOXYB2_FULL_46_23]HBU70267.1 exodeoxyribonuclease VII large subunit [Elusimicrobiota bacterium]